MVLTAIGLVVSSTWVFGDDHDKRRSSIARWWEEARLDVAPVDNDLYRAECGSCHFAYPPGLLPARSWEDVIARLDDHFGENAELDPQTTGELVLYLTANSADRSGYWYKRSKRFAHSVDIGKDTPLRITEVSYFQRKHDEVPKWVVKPGDRSPSRVRFAQCDGCHTGADKGSFDEDDVQIPGYGKWDD